ncbi:MAG TPA: winged helix-turn-helix domain-containing protein [Bryobacteraceae bacterium]|nr:winged helix-turn-helix domain-containing protein [Bryobacteraceae bacterium]
MQVISKEGPSTAPGTYRVGEFELFPSERQLRHQNQLVPLPPKAFDALLLLVRNAERLVRKEELVHVLWPDTHVAEANLTNTIVMLRKIFGRDAIQTVSKFGYRFASQVLSEPGVDHAAYAHFVRAKELVTERSLESMLRARDLCLLCIAGDPGFAPAWAWLGRSCRLIEKFSGQRSVNLELAQAALQRSLILDPDLACAHHFYTQLQADLGQAQNAAVRLAQRLGRHPHEAESFAGLVQVLRFCGLLDESVLAHQRSTALDPTLWTSVAHTYFLRGEYEATIESYSGRKGYYLDAAAWAAMGDSQRAISLLCDRLEDRQLSPLMAGLMGSLLALTENRPEDAVALVEETQVDYEPEILFYLARHLSQAGRASAAIRLVRRARLEGFTASLTLAHDPWLAAVRAEDEFASILEDASSAEIAAKLAFDSAGGQRVLRG